MEDHSLDSQADDHLERADSEHLRNEVKLRSKIELTEHELKKEIYLK